ncbi:hypothetical protein' [Enterococcus faecium]|nr:hypothetical protein' [Enterococcus faecium]
MCFLCDSLLAGRVTFLFVAKLFAYQYVVGLGCLVYCVSTSD